MKIQRFNWQIWAGFLLSVAALLSYAFVFVRWPITRDFPWANLLLFGIALVLLFVGVKRAFGTGRRTISKIASSIVAVLGVLVLGFFLFTFFVAAKWLPAARGAPQVGQKAPDFTLSDTSGKSLSLSDLLSSPLKGRTPKGVLLIFYRGYW